MTKQKPLTGWPTKLADGTWGVRLMFRAQPEASLLGRLVNVQARNGNAWQVSVRAVVSCEPPTDRGYIARGVGCVALVRTERVGGCEENDPSPETLTRWGWRRGVCVDSCGDDGWVKRHPVLGVICYECATVDR